MVTLTARAAIKFDLSLIPENATVIKAELSLYAKTKTGNGEGLCENSAKSVYKLTTEWDEEEVDWEKATASADWNTPGGDYETPAIATNSNSRLNVWEDYEVTTSIQDFVNNPGSNNGFLIMFDDSIGLGVDLICSENNDQEKRPKLTIEYEETSGIVSHSDNRNQKIYTLYDLQSFQTLNTVFPDIHQIVIQNCKGQQVESIQFQQRLTVPSVPSGIHFITVIDVKGRQIGKIRYMSTN